MGLYHQFQIAVTFMNHNSFIYKGLGRGKQNSPSKYQRKALLSLLANRN